MERTTIEKDCLLCDTCNKPLSDGKFIALEDSTWYEGWLYCRECEDRYRPDMTVIKNITEGEDLSKTDLAKPMVMEFGF